MRRSHSLHEYFIYHKEIAYTIQRQTFLNFAHLRFASPISQSFCHAVKNTTFISYLQGTKNGDLGEYVVVFHAYQGSVLN
jgi:hypothetical protein